MTITIRRNSFLLSLLFHGIIVLLLFLLTLYTPIPPFGGGGGTSSNLGYVEIAQMSDEPVATENILENPVVQNAQPAQQLNNNDIVTQETEESVIIEKKEKTKPKEIRKANVPVITEKKPLKNPEPPKPKVNESALYKGKNKSTSQGTAASGNGDQGTRDGDPNSKYYGKGQGQGGSGSGGGQGDGIGSGSGPGSGPGFSYSLAGRKIFSPPKIYDNSQETGKVVVEIKVDKYGIVTDAIPGARGSTTTSSNLYRKAKEAALKAKFNASPEGVEEQRGTITFVFVVQ